MAVTAQESSNPTQSAYAALAALRDAGGTRTRLLLEALSRISTHFRAPFACWYSRIGADVLSEEYHNGPTSPGFWRPAVREVLNEATARGRATARLLAARDGSGRIALLAAPLLDSHGEACGAIGLVCGSAEADASARLAQLEALGALALQALTAHAATGGGNAAQQREARGVQAGALARAADCDTETALAYSITNGLRNKFGFEQVVLGAVRRRRVELLSISGLDDVKSRSPGVRAIAAALDECLDHGASIVAQRAESGADLSPAFRLHESWRAAAHGAAVASIPLVFRGECVAVLGVRASANQPFTADSLQKLRATVETYAGALRLMREARRSLPRHALDAAHHAVRWVGQGGWGRRIAVGASTLAALWFVFGTLPYRLAADSVVRAEQQITLSMPFDGTLANLAAAAGDAVRAGQLLAEIDASALKLQARELEAEIEVSKTTATRALAAQSPVEARLAQANLELLHARRATVLRQIEQARINAPFDGLVVDGDLRQQVGAALPRGTPLLQVAPGEGWLLEIELPEHALSVIAAGATGRFAPLAQPELSAPIEVTRVRASGEVRNGRSVFVAEARLTLATGWLRPGIQGVVKLDGGRKPVWWLTFRRAADYLWLNYWL